MHSTDFQVIDSLQGALGFRSYIPMSSKMHNLTRRWHDEFSREPPMQAIWAYDTTWALAESVERAEVPQNGSMLLSEILKTKFHGASGKFSLSGNKMVSNGYEIINAIDYGERKVGYWTLSNGLKRAHLPFNGIVPHSNEIEDVVWPGGSTMAPKGWISQTKVGKTLKIGVRTGLTFKNFVDTYYDARKNRTTADGFSVDVFNACIHALPYEVSYEFIPFATGSYDYLINKVYNQELDGVLGDTTILASRSQYVDFTATYTDVGTAMLIKNKEKNYWKFLKPLNVDLWLTYFVFGIVAIIPLWAIYTVNQQQHESTPSQQIGTIASLILLAVFLAQRERLQRNLANILMFVWLAVVILLFKQSYIATQTSMSSVEQVELASKQGIVGFHGGSFFSNLKLTDNMLKPYQSYQDYADALSKGGNHGGADAIIDEVPYIKMFLKMYPHEYTMVLSKPVTSGFGFIFAKGSPLITDISREIAKLREDGTLTNLENKWFGKDISLSSSTMLETPNLYRFWGLFIVIGVSLALALTVLALYLVHAKMELGTVISFLLGQYLVATFTDLWSIISFPARQSLLATVRNLWYRRIIR
ncbi:hypothetical protein E3N88_20318 [Mikania micrantha]|uniref:Ionotropic glutamate receptor C-terminal domain-containing protein n=1 Tax=Mikania micrantha TaxID=192012 RepID=A0A5N6NJ95_9ASTR|nr:hypothetical protein E3N88_20318 [Mikania micrantha]